MSQQLDRSKPLWEMWVVEGLDGGDRFAIVSKIHHCMVDGMSSVDLLAVLLTVEPTDHVDAPVRWIPRPIPSWWQMLSAEASRRTHTPFETISGFRQVVADVRDPRSDIRTMWRGARGMLRSSLRTVSDTPLNKPIGPHRRFDSRESASGAIPGGVRRAARTAVRHACGWAVLGVGDRCRRMSRDRLTPRGLVR